MLPIKKTIFMGLFLIVQSLFAQDFERVDASLLLYPNRFNSPEELSNFITRDFQTDAEKVRAIYSWIIQNIAYDPNEYKNFDYRFSNYRERNKKEEITREKIIQRTLQKGVAVCEGYAFLFEKLCELQGITNYLVRGNTKTTIESIGEDFNINHMWNVAYINNEAFLFDATWGAGKFQDTFIKEPNYFYFKADPSLLINTHYPNLVEDALVINAISKEEFIQSPLIIDKQLHSKDLLRPKNGIILKEALLGEIPFQIKNRQPVSIAYSFGEDLVEIENFVNTDAYLEFKVPINKSATSLLIYFDGEPAVGYKLK